MTGRRAIVGLCMLCALLVSAFAAQSASAISGTTAFTCKKGPGDGGVTYSTAHCKPGEPTGEFGHYSIKENTTTSLTGNSNGEATKLKATVGGVGVTLTSSKLSGTGTLKNTVEVGGANDKEHYIHGEGTITYEEVIVEGFGGKCLVYEDVAGEKGALGMVTTEKLTATTTGQGHKAKFSPAAGTVFARFWILDKNKKTSAEGGECTIGATYVVSGSLIATIEGATLKTTHAEVTTQNTLKMGPTEVGSKAGLEGVLTLEGHDPEIANDPYNPISATTVTT